DDVVDFRETLESGGLDIDAGAPLNAVHDDWQRHSAGDRLEVLDEPFLRRLVVVRRDGQDAVGAHAVQLLGELDNLGSVISASAGEHGNLAFSFLQRDFDHAQVFLMRQGRAFAGGAARNQKIDAGLDLATDQPSQNLFVERL